MKIFDWDFAFCQTHNPNKLKWLQSVQNSPVSEEEFVAKWGAFPRYGRRPSKKYGPSNAKKAYKQLKENFGFFNFKGENHE